MGGAFWEDGGILGRRRKQEEQWERRKLSWREAAIGGRDEIRSRDVSVSSIDRKSVV